MLVSVNPGLRLNFLSRASQPSGACVSPGRHVRPDLVSIPVKYEDAGKVLPYRHLCDQAMSLVCAASPMSLI